MLKRTILTAALVVVFPIAAMAEGCVQSDGQPGVFINGAGSPDDQCLTADEYRTMVSAESLLEAGLIAEASDNGDGTTTLVHHTGDIEIVASDPLDRIVSADPELEPDAPTVREVLFARSFFGVHPI